MEDKVAIGGRVEFKVVVKIHVVVEGIFEVKVKVRVGFRVVVRGRVVGVEVEVIMGGRV